MEFKNELSESGSGVNIWWHSNFFKFLDFKKNLKIGRSPVGKMYVVPALLHNARSCFYEAITSKYFECKPPIIEEYFTH